jgi:hypothetical protein
MQVLREGKLYSIMKSRKLSVHQMVNLLYVSLFYWFYIQWTQGHLTIMAFDATKKYDSFSNDSLYRPACSHVMYI